MHIETSKIEHAMTMPSDAIQLSHLEQTIYFACQRQGIILLDAGIASRFNLCGGVDEVARTISVLIEKATSDKLLDYLRRMENQALAQRLGFVLERLSTLQSIDEDLIGDIARLAGEHTYLLDPHGTSEGEVSPRWNIRENIDILKEI